jgi:hypothetical protein
LHFGTFLWLAYPIFCLSCCLKLAQWVLLGPAILYMWCETAYPSFMLGNWWELPRRCILPRRNFPDETPQNKTAQRL